MPDSLRGGLKSAAGMRGQWDADLMLRQLDLCLSTFVVTLKMALPKQRSLHACSLILFIPLHVCSAGSSCRLGPPDWCSLLLLPDTMGYTVPLHGCVGSDVSWGLPHLGLCCSYLSHCITNTFNARVFLGAVSFCSYCEWAPDNSLAGCQQQLFHTGETVAFRAQLQSFIGVGEDQTLLQDPKCHASHTCVHFSREATFNTSCLVEVIA